MPVGLGFFLAVFTDGNNSKPDVADCSKTKGNSLVLERCQRKFAKFFFNWYMDRPGLFFFFLNPQWWIAYVQSESLIGRGFKKYIFW